jgi:hypothetical protein
LRDKRGEIGRISISVVLALPEDRTCGKLAAIGAPSTAATLVRGGTGSV